jgi:hypothetical protein
MKELQIAFGKGIRYTIQTSRYIMPHVENLCQCKIRIARLTTPLHVTLVLRH